MLNVSGLYLDPLQSSHMTYTSGKKYISTFIVPSPLHDSHLPPGTLKEKRPGLYPRIFDSSVREYRFLIISNTPE